MSLYSSAVKKPITTVLLFIGIVLFGLFSFQRLSVDLLPNIELGQLYVLTSYPGASPIDVENNVTKPIENVLNGIANQKHIVSDSKEGLSIVRLEFNEGIDMEEATNDVRDKLDFLAEILPEAVRRPAIYKFTTDDIPIQIIVAKAKESSKGLDKILQEKVANPLGRIEGVGGVNVSGSIKRKIQVYCDPFALEAYHITIDQIRAIIAAENNNTPAGKVLEGSKNFSIRIHGEIKDPKEIEDIIIKQQNGKIVYLKDVARVEDTSPESQQEFYLNGERSAAVIVTKQSGANSVAISSRITDLLPSIKASLPKDVELETTLDTSRFIKDTIFSLGNTIFITFFVVMLVVLLFLGRWRATFIIVVTIPISLISAFIYLMFSGNSLNIISMSSLSIAIGMVVDDAIVVLENITNHIEKGGRPKESAIYATNEVAISVVASTLTMLAVFLPLTMLGGMAGIMFRQLGWIISIVMIVSTIGALSLTPAMCAYILRKKEKNKKQVFQSSFTSLTSIYVRALSWSLRHRSLSIFIAIVIFIISIFMGKMVKTAFMPDMDGTEIQAQITLPVGTNVKETREKVLKITKQMLDEFPEIVNCTTMLGISDVTNAYATIRGGGENVADLNISLKGSTERERTAFEIADLLRKLIAEKTGIQSSTVKVAGGPAGGGPPVTLEVYGYDLNLTSKIAKSLENRLFEEQVCSEIYNDQDLDVPEYQFVFDKQQLAKNGLSSYSVSQSISGSIKGLLASFYREEGGEYEILVHLAPEYRNHLQALDRILIATPYGKSVQLSSLGHFKQVYSPPSIKRKDRERVITLSLTAKPGIAMSDLVLAAKKVMEEEHIPQGITCRIGGTYEMQQKSFGDLSLLLVLIVLLVYIVMAAQFESLSDPFVIMFSVPFAFTGVIVGLSVTQVPLSVIAFIGAIMLVGIVVKNGIVLIDYIRLCRERGIAIRKSVLLAGSSRLRPVLMTTLTTVLGMIPMARGIGEGSETWQPLGVTVAFGLSISTFVTLFLIPIIYASFHNRKMKRRRKKLAKRL